MTPDPQLQEAGRLVRIADKGEDSSRNELYRQAAEMIDKRMAENERLTQREVADQMGVHQKTVWLLLESLTRARVTKSDFVMDWKSGPHKPVPAKLDKQVELAQQLLQRPGVAEAVVRSKTPAANAVKRAVQTDNNEEQQRWADAHRRERERNARPISGMLGQITLSLQGWAGELIRIEPDLVEANDAFMAHSVAVALRDLAKQCNRIADRIDVGTAPVDENVIEVR